VLLDDALEKSAAAAGRWSGAIELRRLCGGLREVSRRWGRQTESRPARRVRFQYARVTIQYIGGNR
jgi:hypothetical protein